MAPIDHIYATYAGKGVFKKVIPLTGYNKRNASTYYAYHESTGHDTANCRQLKDKLRHCSSKQANGVGYEGIKKA